MLLSPAGLSLALMQIFSHPPPPSTSPPPLSRVGRTSPQALQTATTWDMHIQTPSAPEFQTPTLRTACPWTPVMWLQWAKQGVLLLNTVLTVRAHTANSHAKKGWEAFTDAAIRAISLKQGGSRVPAMGQACAAEGPADQPAPPSHPHQLSSLGPVCQSGELPAPPKTA